MSRGLVVSLMRGVLCVLCVLCVVPTSIAASLTAPQRETILTEALSAYDTGIASLRSDPEQARRSFDDAAERFQLLVDDGVANGLLHYDLGNAHYQRGDVGRAILNYRRALRLRPGDDRIRTNLDAARSRRATRIEVTGGRALTDALVGWHDRVAFGARMTVAIVAWLVLWGAFAAYVFHRRSAWIWTAVVAGAVAVATGTSIGVELYGDRAAEGVTLQDGVVVRKGNGDGFEPQFEEPLSAGVEFTVLEARGDWWQIELPDGGTGWIPVDAAELI